MGLSKTTLDRIANDAKEKFPIPVVFADQPGCMNKREGYIAGATAENERAKGLVDALEAFILWQGSTLKNWPVMKQAHEALQQFKDGKGKEVAQTKKLHSGNKHQWQDDWDIDEQGELNEETN